MVNATGINLDTAIYHKYAHVNYILNNVFTEISKSGIKMMYRLKAEEIGFTTESTIDGTHPNDLEMMQHAKA